MLLFATFHYKNKIQEVLTNCSSLLLKLRGYFLFFQKVGKRHRRVRLFSPSSEQQGLSPDGQQVSKSQAYFPASQEENLGKESSGPSSVFLMHSVGILREWVPYLGRQVKGRRRWIDAPRYARRSPVLLSSGQCQGKAISRCDWILTRCKAEAPCSHQTRQRKIGVWQEREQAQ